ncbi:MAG: hypothetical protein A2945_04255 [Candidatus Liptonbacteria bacterium RIFCSPLOWO2_01_FULL_52_25]|uniref:Uncharacterized protein n=1 Tax=Candidatus Liptonbacteria bacterium RIFCSPLOWO2_01_FULL_52_25 TaxID=1798650 RepID=A0A1G2CCM5_9BACT|nr:MAG: hypothetical protein A2945_04255 [Candidatus Liptonbacteria bacterium RIFCSPLOWO2_01_FULL_52_25]
MPFEGRPNHTHASEKSQEAIPTEGEVRAVFEQLTGGEFVEVRKAEDENGLYLWDVRAGDTEYSYMRKGRHPIGGEASHTAIHATFFDGGMPTGGEGVAEFVDGAWKIFI